MQTGELGHGLTAAARFEIPERRIERVARSACGQKLLQRYPAGAALDVVAHGLDRRDHRVHGLAVPGIGHTLAKPAQQHLIFEGRHLDHDHLGFALHTPRNSEGCRERPALVTNMQLTNDDLGHGVDLG